MFLSQSDHYHGVNARINKGMLDLRLTATAIRTAIRMPGHENIEIIIYIYIYYACDVYCYVLKIYQKISRWTMSLYLTSISIS